MAYLGSTIQNFGRGSEEEETSPFGPLSGQTVGAPGEFGPLSSGRSGGPVGMGRSDNPTGMEPPGAATGGSPAINQPGTFVNFERYIAANKDNAQKGANQVISGAHAQGANLTGAIKGSLAGFKAGQGVSGVPTQSTKGPFTEPPTTSPDLLAGIGSPKKGYGKTIAPPIAPDMPKGLFHLVNGKWEVKPRPEYKGASSLADFMGQPEYDKLQKDANKAGENATLLGTDYGLATFLKDKNKNAASYTPGMSRFDAALFGSLEGDQFRDVSKKYSGLGTDLETAQSNSINDARQNKANADQLGAAYDAMLAKYMEGKSSEYEPPPDPYAANKAADAATVARAETQQGHGVLQKSTVSLSEQAYADKDGWGSQWNDYVRNNGYMPYDEWKAKYVKSGKGILQGAIDPINKN